MVAGGRLRPVVLCLVDGMGGPADPEVGAPPGAALRRTDDLLRRWPCSLLDASGGAVGLPDGEPGHAHARQRTIGAGRAAPLELATIDEVIAARRFGRNPGIAQLLRIAADRRSRLHLLGVVSESRAHASFGHLCALIELCDFHEIPVVVHAILDGVPMARRSAMPLLHRLEDFLADRGVIGTLSGRHYSVDAGDDWDRIYPLFQAIVRDKVLGPEAPRFDTVLDALSSAYGQGLDDAAVPPARIGDYHGLQGDFLCDFASQHPVWEWIGEEVGLAFDHRPDGLYGIAALLSRRGLPDAVVADLLMDRDKPVLAFDEHCFATMTEYDAALGLPVMFGPALVEDTCGAVVARAGLQQLRLGESAQRHQLTTYFGGGAAEPLAGEQWQILPSAPLLDLSDPTPRLQTRAVGAAAVEAVRAGRHDFIVVSFAGLDRMARTAASAAVARAVDEVDRAVEELVAAVRAAHGALLLVGGTATRPSGAEPASVATSGSPAAAVPLWLVGDGLSEVPWAERGALADVAPTVLELLGLEPPRAMSGRSLIRRAGGGAAR